MVKVPNNDFVLTKKGYSFDSNYGFSSSLEKDRLKLHISRKESRPKNFFSLNGNQNKESISSISVLVGKNGAGKTSMMRKIAQLCLNKNSDDFVMVYEYDGKLKARYGFIARLSDHTEKRFYERDIANNESELIFSFNTKEAIGRRIGLNSVMEDFDVFYLTNVYVNNWKDLNPLGRTNVWDYSTANLIIRDYQKLNTTTNGQEKISHDYHACAEMTRIISLLDFLTQSRDKEDDKGLGRILDEEIKPNELRLRARERVIDDARQLALVLNKNIKAKNHLDKREISNTLSEYSSCLYNYPSINVFFNLFWNYVAICIMRQLEGNEGSGIPARYKNDKISALVKACKKIKQEYKRSTQGNDCSEHFYGYVTSALQTFGNRNLNEFFNVCSILSKEKITSPSITYVFGQNDRQNLLVMDLIKNYYKTVADSKYYLDFEDLGNY